MQGKLNFIKIIELIYISQKELDIYTLLRLRFNVNIKFEPIWVMVFQR